MKSNLEIIKISIFPNPYIDKGTKDKRFKSGYRVLPAARSKNEIMLTVKHDGYIRTRMTIQTPYGIMICTANDNTTLQATLKMVKSSDFPEGPFTINVKFPVLGLGFSVWEETAR